MMLSDSRIFPSCLNCHTCYQNITFAGASSGAVVLSALQEWSDVEERRLRYELERDVDMHIDFADRSIVSRCCTKCTIHSTFSDAYGNYGTWFDTSLTGWVY